MTIGTGTTCEQGGTWGFGHLGCQQGGLESGHLSSAFECNIYICRQGGDSGGPGQRISYGANVCKIR